MPRFTIKDNDNPYIPPKSYIVDNVLTDDEAIEYHLESLTYSIGSDAVKEYEDNSYTVTWDWGASLLSY